MKTVCATLAAVLLSITPVFADVAEADIEACKAAPTSECLADIGVAIAMEQEKLSTKKGAVEMLAQMGRIDDADALKFRIYRLNGWSPKAARRETDHQMSAYHVQQALLVGESFETATEGVSDEIPHTALMQIAGLSYLAPSLGFKPTQDPRKLAMIMDYADRTDLTKRQKAYAANILYQVGKQEAAKRLFLGLINEPGDPPFIPYGMIKLIGTQTALEVFESYDEIGLNSYERLARAETDPDRAVVFLQKAFDIAKAMPNAKNAYPSMASNIQLAVELGHVEFAKNATEALKAVLKNSNDTTASGNMMLARSLLAINAPTQTIRTHLDTVKGRLLNRSMSDPHGHFGQELGRRYAQLGDVETAVERIVASNDPIRSWQITLRSDLPPGVFDALYEAAHGTLTQSDLAEVKKWLALSLSLAKRTKAEHRIASKAAWEILDQPPQSDINARIYFYNALLMVADRLDDTALTEAVRTRLGVYALETGAFLPLLQAAHLTYQIEQGDTR